MIRMLVRIAEKNEADAAVLLLSLTEVQEPECRDWPDDLAAARMQDPALSLSYWSKAIRDHSVVLIARLRS